MPAMASFLLASTVVTLDCPELTPRPALALAALLPAGLALASTTGAASSSLTDEPHPTSQALTSAAHSEVRKGVMVMLLRCVGPADSPAERSPNRFAHVLAGGQQLGADAAVERGGHQHVAALRARGVDDQLAIGREARALVLDRIAHGAHRATGQVERHDLELAAVAVHVGDGATVRADRRADVVAAVERDALGIAAAGRDAVDLRAAAAVADE